MFYLQIWVIISMDSSNERNSKNSIRNTLVKRKFCDCSHLHKLGNRCHCWVGTYSKCQYCHCLHFLHNFNHFGKLERINFRDDVCFVHMCRRCRLHALVGDHNWNYKHEYHHYQVLLAANQMHFIIFPDNFLVLVSVWTIVLI